MDKFSIELKKFCTILIISLTLTACGASSQTQTASATAGSSTAVTAVSPTSTPEPTPVPTSTPEPTPEPGGITEQVLYQSGNVTITAKSLGDSILGPELAVLVENTSDKDLTVQITDCSVNDFMMAPLFSCNVAAGKESHDTVDFSSTDINQANIQKIKDIQFVFIIMDSSYSVIENSDLITLNTYEGDTFQQTYDDSGQTLLDNGDYKIVMQKINDKDSFWGADIYLYIENNSDKNITFQANDFSVNGLMISPMFSCDVDAHKKAIDSVTILQSELDDNGITEITDFELSFEVIDFSTSEAVYTSDTIKVTF